MCFFDPYSIKTYLRYNMWYNWAGFFTMYFVRVEPSFKYCNDMYVVIRCEAKYMILIHSVLWFSLSCRNLPHRKTSRRDANKHEMLIQCCFNVVHQTRWANIKTTRRRDAKTHETLTQCCFNYGPSSKRNGPIPANTKHLYNIYKMLYQRRRRWADVV